MLITAIGITGLLLILAGFIANEFSLVRIKSFSYNAINLAGAILLGYYAWSMDSIIFLALELIWAAIALYFILKLALKRR